MNSKSFFGLLLLASLWGPSFLFIKVAGRDIPPLTMTAARVSIAAVLLYFVLKLQGGKLSHIQKMWKHFALAGFVGNALPFTLFNWGEIHIDSGLASILNGTTPLFTILIAHFFTQDDRLTPKKIIGSVIGFSGLVLLVAPALMDGIKAGSLGLLAVTTAALCYGANIVYTRKFFRGMPKYVAPIGQLGFAALIMLPLSLIVEKPYELALPSWPALGSLVALAIFGTSIAFVVYYRIMEFTPASALSMVTYLVPIFGIILGVTLLNEQLAWNAYIGCAFILFGVMIVNGFIQIGTLLPKFR